MFGPSDRGLPGSFIFTWRVGGQSGRLGMGTAAVPRPDLPYLTPTTLSTAHYHTLPPSKMVVRSQPLPLIRVTVLGVGGE
jgi:hypothetical protein